MGTSELLPARLANAGASSRIELLARDLHQRVWNMREVLCFGRIPEDPVALLEPGMALSIIGFEVVTDDCLGEMYSDGRLVQVAGTLDPSEKLVRISPNFRPDERRFTTAHELGHALLHPNLGKLHRDRSISGPVHRRERNEIEADQFASVFLMPERLLRRRFFDCFRIDRFSLSDDTAFALCCTSLDKVTARYRSRRDLALALATAISFNGLPFDSLSRYFCVSPTAMAIRLEQLDLL